MRRLLVELSGEHPTLPRAEALALLSGMGPTEPIDDDACILIVDSDADPAAFARRAGLSHRVLAYWCTTEPREEALLAALGSVDLGGKRFSVRARRIEARQPGISASALEGRAGRRLATTGVVDLKAPDVEGHIYLSGRLHAGAMLAEVDRGAFESRKLQFRAYHNPVTMHPRLARAMVNLARVPAGGRLVDFFCGTGGLLIEGALIGLQVAGSDAHPHMVEGAAKTLQALRLTPERLETCDVVDAPDRLGPADGIVADPPYGKAALVKGEIDELYAQAFDAAAGMLTPGRRFVTAFPDPRHVSSHPSSFALEETHAVRVHRSLTRHVGVYRRR